ncbi:MAG TPA: response regulator [Planctomycetota bacterium]|nr:response regulator [Planctomycetota bacterium]
MPETRSIKRVLIVEDDLDIRDVLTQVLEYEGYEVATAGNGREALDYLRSHPKPGLILLDLMMPVMDGWQFRAEQQKTPELANIPVVILSADGNAYQKASTVRAAGFLKKPVELETLLETVGRNCLQAG